MTGVHDADPRAKFGGPGASCRLTAFSKYCWSVLDHVSNGTNYFTKQRGTRIDYVSVHKKGGDRGHPGNSTLLYDDELQTFRAIQSRYKRQSNTAFYNDEGDPVKGWDYPMLFYTGVAYPAMIMRLIHMHLYSADPEFQNYRMLSNDNAFVSTAPHYFTQRTLLAALALDDSTGSNAILVRKPVYELMAMLSQVRGNLLTVSKASHNIDTTSDCLVSSTGLQLTVCCWASNDTNNYMGGPINYKLLLPSHLIGGYYVLRRLSQTSTYDIWKSMGSPPNLTRRNVELLWNKTMIIVSSPQAVTAEIKMAVSGPGVTQLIACKKRENLTRPHTLRFHSIADGLVVISWLHNQISDCFLSYDLQIRRFSTDAFATINEGVILSRTYQYTSEYGVTGDYRVRCKNIMGQASDYSPIATYKY